MPFESPFPPTVFDATFTASAHEHAGAPPETVIRTDQSWAININWTTTGLATGMIAGFWHLHVFLESLGPGADLDLIDPGPGEHIIPLTPGASPVNYSVHFDVAAGRVNIPDPVPATGRLYKVVTSLTFREPGPGGSVGPPGPMAAYVEGPILQFYQPGLQYIQLNLNDAVADARTRLDENPGLVAIILDNEDLPVSMVTTDDLANIGAPGDLRLADIAGQLPLGLVIQASVSMKEFASSPEFVTFSAGTRGIIIYEGDRLVGVLTEATITQYLSSGFEPVGKLWGDTFKYPVGWRHCKQPNHYILRRV